MKKAAIVLFILQAIAVFGGIVGGNDVFNVTNFSDVLTLIGFFSPTIIGVILFVKAKKKEKKSD